MNSDTQVQPLEALSKRSFLPEPACASLNDQEKSRKSLPLRNAPLAAPQPLPSTKLARFLARPEIDTPFLAIDLNLVAEKYLAMRHMLPDALISYAVKANPERQLIECLRKRGAHFAVASIAELTSCLGAGASPEQLSYGNPIKKAEDIARAYALGVRMFGFDSPSELRKIAAHAPGSKVFCRLLVEERGPHWPLGRKFGCEPEMACDLMRQSRRFGLIPQGLAFHIGSQHTDPSQWSFPIRLAARLFAKLAREGIHLELLNLGGGFPVHYRSAVSAQGLYASEIMRAMRRYFGGSMPGMMFEPGRSLVAEAGVIQTEVVLISRKFYFDAYRWVFLDIGKFGGLIETLDESIQYRIRTPHDGKPVGPVILAGPTSDSADILYERSSYQLPLDLREGDRIEILSAGAYTHTYAAVCCNGFPPLRTYCI